MKLLCTQMPHCRYDSFGALVVLLTEDMKENKLKPSQTVGWQCVLSSFLLSWNDKKLEQAGKVKIISVFLNP